MVATPTQADRVAALEAQVQALIKENTQLKERLHKVEQAQEAGDQSLRTGVQEVKSIKTMLAIQKEEQEATHEQINSKIHTAIQEQKMQESLSLKIRIAGLPLAPWNNEEDTFEETLDKLNKILEPINIKYHSITYIDEAKGRVPTGQCIQTFRNKEEPVKLLQQSHLLKGKKPWIAEELTTNQLKAKASELKKMHEARKQGKWAVYRGGKAIIQEFRTPKPRSSPSGDPL